MVASYKCGQRMWVPAERQGGIIVQILGRSNIGLQLDSQSKGQAMFFSPSELRTAERSTSASLAEGFSTAPRAAIHKTPRMLYEERKRSS